MSYPRVWMTDYICALHKLFMSEVSPQISDVTFVRTKIILARAIFDELHRVQFNFLHGLPVELRTAPRSG